MTNSSPSPIATERRIPQPNSRFEHFSHEFIYFEHKCSCLILEPERIIAEIEIFYKAYCTVTVGHCWYMHAEDQIVYYQSTSYKHFPACMHAKDEIDYQTNSFQYRDRLPAKRIIHFLTQAQTPSSKSSLTPPAKYSRTAVLLVVLLFILVWWICLDYWNDAWCLTSISVHHPVELLGCFDLWLSTDISSCSYRSILFWSSRFCPSWQIYVSY